MQHLIREACVEGVAQAKKAQDLGASRIELCGRLDLDGITPEFQIIKEVRQRLRIPIRVMVRPRSGDFCYTENEISVMQEAIDFCGEVGVEGIVFGTLSANHEIDVEVTNALVRQARSKGLKTVFHRAIEATSDIAQSLQLLKSETLVDAILVSGTGGGKAFDHIEELKILIAQFQDRELVVCGKVTNQNLSALHRAIGGTSYHGKLIVGSLV